MAVRTTVGLAVGQTWPIEKGASVRGLQRKEGDENCTGHAQQAFLVAHWGFSYCRPTNWGRRDVLLQCAVCKSKSTMSLLSGTTSLEHCKVLERAANLEYTVTRFQYEHSIRPLASSFQAR